MTTIPLKSCRTGDPIRLRCGCAARVHSLQFIGAHPANMDDAVIRITRACTAAHDAFRVIRVWAGTLVEQIEGDRTLRTIYTR